MVTHKKQEGKNCIYYCTFTCLDWLHLFEITDFYENILDWFRLLVKQNCKITAFVAMPNYLHFMIYVPDTAKDINTLVANGKRFMAYKIVKKLKKYKQNELLEKLSDKLHQNEINSGKLHKVFKASFDCKLCETENFIKQKLDYMHNKPVGGKWNLAEDILKYRYSSARFYENDDNEFYFLTHYEDVF